jgi:hypothetical protein
MRLNVRFRVVSKLQRGDELSVTVQFLSFNPPGAMLIQIPCTPQEYASAAIGYEYTLQRVMEASA